MKLTKKQEKIKDWLLEHPGYIKKSAENIPHNKLYYGVLVKDIEIALKEARRETYQLNKLVDLALKTKPISSNVANSIRESLAKSDKLNKKPIGDLRDIPGTYYVTGCCHAPWQNKSMYESVFNYLDKEVELQGLILAGDIADINSLSSHDSGKIPIKGVTLDWEYKEVNKFLDEFDDLNIKGSKDFIYGNHCDRYNRAIKNVDVAKYGKSLISPIEGLKLEERNYNVFSNWKNDSIKLGKHLEINHGEFLNVHSAKKTIDTYRTSVLYFHTHRFQIYIEGLVGGFNMGSGADFNAPIFNYATRAMKTSWINSSCLVTLDKEGLYHVQPLMFINNKLIINGKIY